eukprot:CAMPEP_0113538672 /NCGR_PEP_ID=MMETSP0015_2-20120614/7495_1 /TAXON_ID=2838 /ORGANISM="Odontella" /LENGTH=741 /DNA_ID=CAMNT_0000438271 /DNA_START=484 /DNA_END=2709 /DNA_ORIENTATION=+ /assembly_acc=CAM_ASM_000160
MRLLAASNFRSGVRRAAVVSSSGSSSSVVAPAVATGSSSVHSPLHLLTAASSSPAFASPKASPRSLSTTVTPERPSDRFEGMRERGIFDSSNLLRFETLHEMQRNASVAYAPNDMFGTYEENSEYGGGTGGDGGGTFKWMSYEKFGDKVDTCRTVLKDLGIGEYSKVGIISNNRWEWACISSAAHSLNATVVPMYEAQLPKDWTYILNDSECSVLFCATQDIHDRVHTDVLPSTPSVKASLCLDAPSGYEYSFATAMDRAVRGAAEGNDGSGTPIVAPTPEDLAGLIYTSGTTGRPKGVEMMHSNQVSNVRSVRSMADDVHDFIRQSDRSLAFLPWAHCYGQTCELYCTMAHGGSMGVGRGVPFILDDLAMVQPTVLFAVPTLYKRVYDGVQNAIESSSPLKKKMMKKALALGRRNFESEHGGAPLGLLEKVQHRALDGIVLSKIRGRFGGKMRHAFAGGAACPREVIEFMDCVGIPICEGYGLTETSPIITLNVPKDRLPGSCGKPVGNVEVVIMGEDGNLVEDGEEGEICCYGPNVMKGYHKNKEATDEVITLAPDGKSRLFHTGDLGRQDSDGWVRITGRLKEQYKLENGKYVCPTPIEEAIGLSRFVAQVVLAGANRPHNVALIVPDWAAVRSELRVGDDVDEEDLVNDERVRSLMDGEIASTCAGVKKFEVPKDWAVVAPFTASNNMLTPKMSIRRHVVLRTYEDAIAHMYGDEAIVDHLEPADGGHHDDEENKVA